MLQLGDPSEYFSVAMVAETIVGLVFKHILNKYCIFYNL